MNRLYKTTCTILVVFCLVLQSFGTMLVLPVDTDAQPASLNKSPAGMVSVAIPLADIHDAADLIPQEEQTERATMVFAELESVHSTLTDFLPESPGSSKFPPLLHSLYPSPLYTLHRPPNSAA